MSRSGGWQKPAPAILAAFRGAFGGGRATVWLLIERLKDEPFAILGVNTLQRAVDELLAEMKPARKDG